MEQPGQTASWADSVLDPVAFTTAMPPPGCEGMASMRDDSASGGGFSFGLGLLPRSRELGTNQDPPWKTDCIC